MKKLNFALVYGKEINAGWEKNWYGQFEQVFVRCRKNGTYTITFDTAVYSPQEIVTKLLQGEQLIIWKNGRLLVDHPQTKTPHI